MAVRKIKNSWWVDFRHDHVRYRKRSPENSKTGAEAYEALLRQKLARGEPITSAKTDKVEKEKEQKFKEFAWKWFETYVQINNKASEISRKKYALRTNLAPFFGNTPINKISTQQVEEYKSMKIKEGVTPKTLNNQLTVLSSCLHTAQDWYDIPKLPKIKKLKLPPLKFDFLRPDECEQLLSHLSGMWRDIVFIASQTGLRLGELKALQWSDINWHNRTLTVRHSWCNYKKGLVSPKSNRERHIPLTDGLYQLLWERRRSEGFIFVDERGQQFNSKRVNVEIARACTAAGMRVITCHTLRHTFASHLAMAGAPLKAIQELLGHAEIQTTMRYAHLAPSSLRTTVDLLEPVRISLEKFGQPVGNR